MIFCVRDCGIAIYFTETARSSKLKFSFPLYGFLFSCLVFFFNTIFPSGLLTADPAGHALGSIYILSLSPEFYQFGRGISKALDLHTGLRPDKNQKLSRHVPPLKLLMETAEFFSMLVDIMTNNAKYTTNCTLHPTPTSEPLAKVKLSFCTLS